MKLYAIETPAPGYTFKNENGVPKELINFMVKNGYKVVDGSTDNVVELEIRDFENRMGPDKIHKKLVKKAKRTEIKPHARKEPPSYLCTALSLQNRPDRVTENGENNYLLKDKISRKYLKSLKKRGCGVTKIGKTGTYRVSVQGVVLDKRDWILNDVKKEIQSGLVRKSHNVKILETDDDYFCMEITPKLSRKEITRIDKTVVELSGNENAGIYAAKIA